MVGREAADHVRHDMHHVAVIFGEELVGNLDRADFRDPADVEQLLRDISALIDHASGSQRQTVRYPDPQRSGAKPSTSRGEARRLTVAIPLVAAALAGGLLLYRHLVIPAPAPLNPSPSERGERGATQTRLTPSHRPLLPIAGAFEEDRWSKLSGGTADSASGGHRFIAGELQIFTHRGPVLIVARDTSTERDFSYSVRASVVSGPTQVGYGLVFGIKDASTYFRFAKRNSGDYQVTEARGGRHLVLVPWTSSPVIKGIQQTQTIEIATEGPFVTLIVDGKTLERVKLPRPPVGNVGIAVASPGLTVNFSHVVFGPRR